MARKPIIQRIALEGGDAIKQQLLALGDAGEKAFAQIKNAALKADLDKFSASLNKVGSDLATVGRRIALLGAGLATAAGGAAVAVVSLAKAGGEAADAAGKAAQKTGLQIDAYGRLEFAAKQADVSQEEFVAGMSKLNKAIAAAATETKKIGDVVDTAGVKVTRFGGKVKDATKPVKDAGNIFTKLGVRIKDVNGKLRSNEDIVLDVAEAFKRMPDSALKSALAIELFGKAGANLLPFLNEGKTGLRELGEEAAKLGILFTPEQFALGDDLGDALDSVGAAVKAVRAQLGLLFAPAVLALAQGLTDIIVANKDAILQLGQTAARVFAGVLGDLLHLLSGNTQNIKNPWIREWSAAIIQFGSDVAGVFNGLVLPAFKLLREAAQFVADQINRLFGSDITAGELALGAALLSLLGVFTLLGSVIGVVVAGLGLLAGLVGGIPLAIAAAAVAAGVLIGVFWTDIQAGAAATWQFITEGAAAAWAAVGQGVTDLWGQVVAAFQAGQQMAVDAFNGIVEAIVSVWGSLVDRLGQIASQIAERIVSAFNGITQRIQTILNSIVEIARSVLSRVTALVDSIISKINAAIAAAKRLIGLGGNSGGGGDSQGFAGGGSVRGPGGPRSDLIPAWLSNGEFVIQAAAVKKLGLGFLHALNNGVMPSLKSLRGFKMGGVVDGFNRSMQIPRFADGGLAKLAPATSSTSQSRGTPLFFSFPGTDEVFEAITDTFVARRMQTAAVKAGLLSTGRKPLRGT